MGDFKYQISLYNLFDYIGVERHLEKMAAKGWRFTSIGNFFWIYRRLVSIIRIKNCKISFFQM